jgi:hypothetical protein
VAVALLMCTSKAADGGRARPLAATSTFSSVRQNITRYVAFSLVPLSDEGGGGWKLCQERCASALSPCS